eukprot:TRINITY_DN29431_c0_g7_i1.p3 TRINITY_DN29431_c0_g7~~TRINITY_DN29431_c0_g7_i1.p3  ORF type:complete len:119 (-),score=8.31 TRINITY_DN29431_c0_g7_i1:169-525(-)
MVGCILFTQVVVVDIGANGNYEYMSWCKQRCQEKNKIGLFLSCSTVEKFFIIYFKTIYKSNENIEFLGNLAKKLTKTSMKVENQKKQVSIKKIQKNPQASPLRDFIRDFCKTSAGGGG